MRLPLSFIIVFLLTTIPRIRAVEYPAKLIWDRAPHNAFTDLIAFEDRVFCVFREGSGHIPGENGRIRGIASADGEKWESVGLMGVEGVDLRDPKLSVAADGRLMLLMGGSYYEGKKILRRLPRVAFWDAGTQEFGDSVPVEIDGAIQGDNDWLWRVTWNDRIGYGILYQARDEGRWDCHLVKTSDGIHYALVKTLGLEGKPNESTVRFDPDDTLRLVVRNEDGKNRGHFGTSRPPYSEWDWKEIPVRLGGPDFVRISEGNWILGTRHYANPTRTCLGRLHSDGAFTPQVFLPSAGDTSYPGLLPRDGKLWVSYYSSHGGKTAIYLAMVPFEAFDK
jgi:hypothetical protein